MRTVALRIDTYGKHKKYGPSVYKVGHGERLLLEAGWQVVHQSGRLWGYTYMSPPPGKGCKRPVIQTTVPDETEIAQLASELHKARRPWEGSIHGWPVIYSPRHTATQASTIHSLGEKPREETWKQTEPAKLEIGEPCLWKVSLWWERGDDAPPRRHEEFENEVQL